MCSCLIFWLEFGNDTALSARGLFSALWRISGYGDVRVNICNCESTVFRVVIRKTANQLDIFVRSDIIISDILSRSTNSCNT